MPYLIFSHVNKYHDIDNDALTWIGNNFFGGTEYSIFSDEYGYLNRYSKWNFDKTLKELPKPIYNGNSKEFEAILCEELETLRNKDFTFMYSGGIDSSCILVSLLKIGITKFNIMYSEESLDEYPLMFKILNQYPNISHIMFDCDNFGDKCNKIMEQMPLMTGSYSDKLFISNFHSHWDAFEYDNWKDFMKTKANSDIIDMLDESFKFYGVNVINPSQFFFWISFSVTSQFGQPFLYLLSLPNGQNHYSPFLNKKFLNWSMSRFDKIKTCECIPSNCKIEMKEIIRNFTKDNEYYRTKNKERSIKKMLKHNKKLGYFIIDSDKIRRFNEDFFNINRLVKYTEQLYRNG